MWNTLNYNEWWMQINIVPEQVQAWWIHQGCQDWKGQHVHLPLVASSPLPVVIIGTTSSIINHHSINKSSFIYRFFLIIVISIKIHIWSSQSDGLKLNQSILLYWALSSKFELLVWEFLVFIIISILTQKN